MTISFAFPQTRFSGSNQSSLYQTPSAASTVSSFSSVKDNDLAPEGRDSVLLSKAKEAARSHKAVSSAKKQADANLERHDLECSVLHATDEMLRPQGLQVHPQQMQVHNENHSLAKMLSFITNGHHQESKESTRSVLRALKQKEDPNSEKTSSNFFKDLLRQRAEEPRVKDAEE